MFEVEDAIERVIAGPEKKSRIISEEEKKIIAFHEAGHALLSHILPNTDPIHKISIISRGKALGYVITLPEADKFLKTKREMLDNITQLLGGRVSEEMNFDDITSGAQNDLDRSTKLARKMVTEFGMSPKIGPITYRIDEEEVFLGKELMSRPHYSEEIASEIDREVNRIITESYQIAKQILTENKDALVMLANNLMEKETLSRDQVMKMLFDVKSQKKAKQAEPAGKVYPGKGKSSASKVNTAKSRSNAGKKTDVKKLSRTKAYQILGLKNGASEEEIRDAYDSLILQTTSEEQVRDVKEAYSLLMDSQKAKIT
jgi:cell division protease FtsH